MSLLLSTVAAGGAPHDDGGRPTVGVYCKHWLPASQTFVRDHVTSLRRYRPVAITSSLVADGLTVDSVAIKQVPRWTMSARARRWMARRGHHPNVRQTIERAGVDLVHAHFGTGGVVVRRACRRLGLPLVVTFHGYDLTVDADDVANEHRLGIGYAEQRHALLHDAAAIVTVSQYLAGRLAQLGADPAKVHVIPCGVDLGGFEPTPVTSGRRVLFVGRLVEKKGCADLLRAAAAAPRATVVVIGDGPLRDELTRLAADLDVHAVFLGMRPHAAVREEMRRAQIVAAPSRTASDGDQEGLPMVVQEAAAAARPVVGYRHSGIPEAVVDNQTGLLVDEGDVGGLGDAIASLLDDHQQSMEMGAAARDLAVTRFSLEAATGRIERIYDRVASLTPATMSGRMTDELVSG